MSRTHPSDLLNLRPSRLKNSFAGTVSGNTYDSSGPGPRTPS